ncbi:uncharacterized protein DNG_07001 [Cephalotrichum gorgonifer]|uniref:Uncharacterized protein n=1 Tax=Cephalotrichum gorgonifer TaxID=2041049 RepID=A0AAE8N3S7_9PEZI|nr:uncharacterized protein DNG_07001 [Cephalotrichum gorgonifer]
MAGCCCCRTNRKDKLRRRRDPVILRRRLRLLKITQCATLVVYLLASWALVVPWYSLLVTGVTFAITTVPALFCAVDGYKSRRPLVTSITADSVSLVLQMLTVVGLFLTPSQVQCFSKRMWIAFILSNLLFASYIHTIVRTAILIANLRNQDVDPPTYPSHEGPPPYSSLDMPLPLSASGVPGIGGEDTSVAPSETLRWVVVTPDWSGGSDTGDEYGEDRPLLRL